MKDVLLILTGYVLGSMPWGYWLPRIFSGLDILKGLAATLLGVWLGSELVGLFAGIAALIGHWRPLFIGFGRGGKIVATTGGVALPLAPLATPAAASVWIIALLATRHTSVA